MPATTSRPTPAPAPTTPATAPPPSLRTQVPGYQISPATSPYPAATSHLPSYTVPRTVEYPRYTAPVSVAPATSPPTAAPTTIAPIGTHLSVPPSTLPLYTKAQNAHVSPVFAALSGVGFFLAAVIMATRFVMTRPRRRR